LPNINGRPANKKKAKEAESEEKEESSFEGEQSIEVKKAVKKKVVPG
jgi:hypothetical protein